MEQVCLGPGALQQYAYNVKSPKPGSIRNREAPRMQSVSSSNRSEQQGNLVGMWIYTEQKSGLCRETW